MMKKRTNAAHTLCACLCLLMTGVCCEESRTTSSLPATSTPPSTAAGSTTSFVDPQRPISGLATAGEADRRATTSGNGGTESITRRPSSLSVGSNSAVTLVDGDYEGSAAFSPYTTASNTTSSFNTSCTPRGKGLICKYDQVATWGGVVIGATFDLHGAYSAVARQCPAWSFQREEAVWKTQAVLYAKDFFLDDIQRRAGAQVRLVTNAFGAPLFELLGIRIRDTCSSPLVGVANAVELTVRDREAAPSCDPRSLVMLGPADSAELGSVVFIGDAQGVPQISFWATSSEFDDLNQYPYAFRSLPSDAYQVRAMADLILHFGWQYVALVASADNLYAQQSQASLRSDTFRHLFCVDVRHEHVISLEDRAGMVNTVRSLKADPDIKLVVLFSLVEVAEEFLHTMVREKYTDVVLLGSEDWVTRLDFSQYTELPGIIGIAPRHIQAGLLANISQGMQTVFSNGTKLAAYWDRNPWLRMYLEERYKCRLRTSTQMPCVEQATTNVHVKCGNDKVLLRNASTPYSILSVLETVFITLDLAFQSLAASAGNSSAINRTSSSQDAGSVTFPQQCNRLDENQMRCMLRELHVPCDEDVQVYIPDAYKTKDAQGTTRCLLFHPDTQSAMPLYWALNVQKSPSTGKFLLEEIGHWQGVYKDWDKSRRLTIYNTSVDWRANGKLTPITDFSSVPSFICNPLCPPGTRAARSNRSTCCWRCELCPQGAISHGDKNDTCVPCPPGQTPHQNYSHCIDIPAHYISITSSYGIIILTEASLGLVVLLTTTILLYRYRHKPNIKACDLRLSVIMLVSGVFGFFSAILALLHPRKEQCWLILLFCTPWTLICSATVLVKTNRFHLIFNAGHPGKRRILSTPVQMTLILILAFVGEAIAVCAVIISAPNVERRVSGIDSVDLVCDSGEFTLWYGSIVAYNLLLIVVCLVAAFRVRNLPEQYNEARFIFMAAFCVCIVWLGLGPAFFITAGVLQPFIIALASSAQIWSLWFCLFAPRLHQVLTKNRLTRFRATLSAAISPTFAHVLRRTSEAHEEEIRRRGLQSDASLFSNGLPERRQDFFASDPEDDISVFGEATSQYPRRQGSLYMPSSGSFPVNSMASSGYALGRRHSHDSAGIDVLPGQSS